ncbi:hypothetical protein KNJ79_06400 [Sphingopyxis indica]|nr:hypothetical protein KNJ79_06400 [Sphingopyxis indica]
MAARLERDVPGAEIRVDDALVALSSLFASLVVARREMSDVPPIKGQATIHRLAKAQLALVGVSADIMRIHGDVAEMGAEVAGYDLHDCPKKTGRLTTPPASAGS